MRPDNTTDPAATALNWPDCRNARDLGGLPTVDGGVTRAGVLYRADGLFRLTPAGIAAIRAAGISRILDLRWPWECERHPSPFAGDPLYLHVPLLEDVLSYDPPHDSYGPMLDHNGDRIARAFSALATAPPGGVLIHCHGGRDRTGGLIALALAVAGVTPEAIVADYGRSPETSPAAMARTLTHVDVLYGGAEPYLRQIGVPARAIEAVRRRLRS
ncbi:protein tyrosine/serine phosphatase [Actinoplanes tereljensis]|uniref:Protein-tyrosine-phosphatase n=1 Tax=Paractinoplanes tereljensis TaxID=571912 RepID=A0A919NMX9_9ACTN|nr:tyrosine-protein phosphatase [Actinoplanes tereljensis]GIF20747.1 protein-tyrosine-phosphatase [Actinoplanes tereljensis]